MSDLNKAVLLVNLGSPDSCEVDDVRRYLDEFLMDGRVIDVPRWLRHIIVRWFILPKRPADSAEAYKAIWTDEGSPLITISRKVQTLLQQNVDIPVELGMRYGNPSIESSLTRLMAKNPGLEEVLLIPLYPHYAMSSYESVVVKTEEVIQQHFPQLKLHIFPAFFDKDEYNNALAASMGSYLKEEFDYVLFSYHGLPERHIKKTDLTKAHCYKVDDCCHVDSPAHQFCYRHQVIRTTEIMSEKLKLSKDRHSFSFQSRLGRDKWMEPYTEPAIEKLAHAGVKKLAVVCPAFVSDCLETLEEIGMRARELFIEAGGEELTLIPCMNESPEWIEALKTWVENHSWQKETAK